MAGSSSGKMGQQEPPNELSAKQRFADEALGQPFEMRRRSVMNPNHAAGPLSGLIHLSLVQWFAIHAYHGAFGIVCVWVSIQCFTKIHTSLSQFVGSIFAMSAIGLLGLSIKVLIGIINGREEAVTIGTDGITHDQRFESWADISEFYGTAYFNGISLGYTANRGKSMSKDTCRRRHCFPSANSGN